MSGGGAPRVRRFEEQRWILDNIIQTVGVEWDQPRLNYMSAPGGVEAMGDFRAAAGRIQKYADVDREFMAAARRRQAKAEAAEAAGHTVAARESYFIAALLWATARWPIHEANERLLDLEKKMNHCYAKYIEYADHPIEHIEIPFGNQSLPGYLHLPRKPQNGEKFPVVIGSQGMDGCKETGAAMYGDKLLERGIAVFAMDGPGQGECFSRRVLVTESNHADAVKATIDVLAKRPELDAGKIGYKGTSFASYFGTIAAGALGDRLKAIAVYAVCHEPGAHTIFNLASPTFKMRFMYMAGFEDEAEFDKFMPKLDARAAASKITAPYLCLAGADDELSPIEHTYDLMERIKSPKKLIVYEGARHAIGAVPAVALSENPQAVMADWLADRFAGKPMKSEKVYIDATGRPTVTPY
jgi:alpha-beta hydrolase superfamily lysophospholipase